MIHLQIISRADENVQSLLKAALGTGKLKTFKTAQVKGGLIIRHTTHLGTISFEPHQGRLLATLTCKNRAKEWQILGAFVGRLADHFSNEIAAVNIQFEPKE